MVVFAAVACSLAAGPIAGAAGSATAASTGGVEAVRQAATATPAPTTVDSTSAQVAFTGWWPTRADAAAVGGSERVGEFGGDAAAFTFTGSSVALVYRQAADRGQAQVYIDNALVGLLDQYGAAPAQRTASYAVAPGTHTIRVVVNRSKQAASTGFFVGVDAFVVNGSVPATATSTPTATPTRTPTATVVAGTPTATSTPLPAGSRRVNAPRFAGGFVPGEAAVFWYGRVTEAENYTDVRVGYTATDLWVQANVFDMRLRYDAQGRAGLLEEYDSVAVEVGAPGGTYRFVSGLSWFEGRGGYQRSSPSVAFETTSGWRGNAPNSQPGAGEDDRGWVTTFRIPFASLGLGGAPAEGAAWPLAVTTYDRDDAAGAQRGQASWSGQVRFGLPGYSPPAGAAAAGTAVIRQGLGGATVPDAAVGGGSDCGGSAAPLYFDRWGSLSYAGRPDMNVQNQGDVADWPCYSKYYVTFPLGAVPAGKRIVSARLVLHQFGGSEPASAQASVVEVSTTDAGWAEGTVTWNTAPGARENVARAVVGVFGGPIVWPGVERAWDVSRAAAAAYGAGGPLALVLYSPDEPYHSGKYFVTSNSGDWNAAGRPTLEVTWSD